MKKDPLISNFWNEAHVVGKKYELTGSEPELIFAFLNISPTLIQKSRKILVIGVGFGYETKFLHAMDKNVSILDISKVALEKFKSISSHQYLPEQLKEVKNSQFDLIISNLVTQHMNNDELRDQLTECVRLLKPEGIFAMQFASRPSKYDDFGKPIPIEKQKAGLVLRSFSNMRSLVATCGGKIAWKSLPIYLPHYNHSWFGIHIMKKSATKIEATTAVGQIRWLYRFIKSCIHLYAKRVHALVA